ncbi:MAG TPA: hypothetical protein VML91_02810 [Burkholderiales bacterium]|nr:hypothetical protein [Burkholderiales bacterium]
MSAFAVGAVTFVCVFSGALVGLVLRNLLPEHHLSPDSKDVVKVVTGLMATLSALVLGLLIASAKSSFDTVNEGFKRAGAQIIVIDRVLAQYGPGAAEIRQLLRSGFAARIDELFSRAGDARGGGPFALRDASAMERLDAKIRALAPADDVQRGLKSRAEALVVDLIQARWVGYEEASNRTPAGFLIVLVSWLTLMFAGFGLFAPRNATAVVSLAIGALAVSTSIFLIEEMARPLDGFIAVSSEPMRSALSVLGK